MICTTHEVTIHTLVALHGQLHEQRVSKEFIEQARRKVSMRKEGKREKEFLDEY